MKYFFVLITLLSAVFSFGQTAGSLDTSFNETGYLISSFEEGTLSEQKIIIQPDGKILLYGTLNVDPFNQDFIIARYLSDGSLDLSFNDTGKRIIDFFGKRDYCYAIALQNDGKILLTGSIASETFIEKIALVRLNSDGTFDETFGDNGIVVSTAENDIDIGRGIMVQSDGKIVVTGKAHTFPQPAKCIAYRYNTDGTPDTTFGEAGIASSNIPEGYFSYFGQLQTDGKIITGGFSYNPPNTADIILLRFNTDGTLDESFGTQGIVQTDYNNQNEYGYALAIQDDNKFLVAGRAGETFAVFRYNNDGSLDDTFGVGGSVYTNFNSLNNTATDIKIQNDGKLLLTGTINTWSNSNSNFVLLRYNIDGQLDTNFGTDGIAITNFGSNEKSTSIAIQEDNKIVLAGRMANAPDADQMVIARYFSGLEIVKTTDTFLKNELLSIYPNPTTQEAILAYSLKKEEIISVNLYNLEGKKVASFLDTEKRTEGHHEESIHFGTRFPAGNYTLVISNGISNSSVNVILN